MPNKLARKRTEEGGDERLSTVQEIIELQEKLYHTNRYIIHLSQLIRKTEGS